MNDKEVINRLYKLLEFYKSADIKDAKLEDLKDIRDVHIDTTKPVHERVFSFWTQIGNPYLFKVGDVKVKVVLMIMVRHFKNYWKHFLLNS